MNENDNVESQVMRFEKETGGLLVPEEVKDELIYYGTQEPLRATFEIDMTPWYAADYFTMINIGA